MLHGLLMERLPEGWRERLHAGGPRPISQWVEPGEGAAFNWRVNLLDDELAEAATPLMQPGAVWHSDHLRGDLVMEHASRERLSLQGYMKAFFLAEKPEARLRLRFLTTTTHKTQGEYALFPSVELIAGALRARLCGLSPDIVLSDDEVLEQIISHTRIVRYRLQSGSFALEGARIQGYTGHIDLSVKGPDPLIRLADALFSFAPWCGVGVKTALGMGGCTVEPIQYGREK